MKVGSITGLTVVAGLATALCVAASGVSAAAAKPAARACFWIRNVDGFASADNQVVYLRADGRKVFELKLFAPCLDVNWNEHIGIRARGSSLICEGANNNVEVFTRSVAHRQRCPVVSVRQLNAQEIAVLPKHARP